MALKEKSNIRQALQRETTGEKSYASLYEVRSGAELNSLSGLLRIAALRQDEIK